MTYRLTFYIFSILPLFGLQCKRSQEATTQIDSYKSTYIHQFKLTYFRKILVKSYNNSEAVQAIISADHSGYAEPILEVSDYKLIDSLTTSDNENMIKDSAQSYQPGYQTGEGTQGKQPLDYILEKLRSKWLDSLAEQRFKLSGLP